MAAGERTLILAEGFSADPHYGKTMRGVLRYRRPDIVAILDSTRTDESHDGVPLVGDVEAARGYEPEVALVGVATQGGRFPPAWGKAGALVGGWDPFRRACPRGASDEETQSNEEVPVGLTRAVLRAGNPSGHRLVLAIPLQSC